MKNLFEMDKKDYNPNGKVYARPSVRAVIVRGEDVLFVSTPIGEGAEKALKKVEDSKVDDAGLVQIVKLRLGYAQLAQKKYDDALKSLSSVTEPAFKAVAEEAKGDVYFAKNDHENAKKAYLNAWNDLVKNKQERPILQIKLQSLGVLVDDPEIERPVLNTQMDENE